VSDADRAAEAEQAELNGRMVVMSAERAATEARFAELAERQQAAWRRHRAAKGLVTRALKDGNAERITAAQERERATWAAADQTARAGIEEMQAINAARLENLGAVLNQIGPTWDAQALALRASCDPSRAAVSACEVTQARYDALAWRAAAARQRERLVAEGVYDESRDPMRGHREPLTDAERQELAGLRELLGGDREAGG
jgi:hypothetical protein